VAVAWQIVFLIISRDPIRYRPLMIPAVLEKGDVRLPRDRALRSRTAERADADGGLLDLMLGMLFVAAYVRTGARIEGA
jgi:hypothetical protein